MAVLLDANYLIAWHQPENIDIPDDPATGIPIAKFKERVEFLIHCLEESNERIVIPTPALTEFLVGAGAAGAPIVAAMSKNKNFRLAEYGRRAAIEAAEIIRHEIYVVGKAQQRPDTWQKAKFDLQIVAIGKIEQVSKVYTNDQGLANRCGRHTLTPILFYELPLPPDDMPPLLKYAKDQSEVGGS